MKHFIVLIVLFFLQIQNAFAASIPLTAQAEISVLTCGTGSELYALYGHTGIRIYDPIQGIDRVYNYGMFDFNTENFYGKFVKGDLMYFVDYDDYQRFVRSYAYEDRSVYEQQLDLTVSQKEQIWQRLNRSLEDDQKYYQYKFIDQNCTTKVVDLLNEVLDAPIITAVEGNTEDYRTILNTYLKNNYFEKLGINLIFGAKVDHASILLFLPDKFMLGLEKTQVNGKPLVKETTILYQSETAEVAPWWNTYWFFCIVLAVGLLGMKSAFVRNTFFIVLGLLGFFFSFVGYYSFHLELLNNNSIFLCNPLFIFIPFWSAPKYKGKLKLLLPLLLMSLVLFAGLNINSEKLLIALPLWIVTLLSLWILKKSQRA